MKPKLSCPACGQPPASMIEDGYSIDLTPWWRYYAQKFNPFKRRRRMVPMATDLNMMLQNKADMWRDEFQRIKALCHGKPLEWLEVAGICDRAMSDIRSNISLIDQREKAADMIAKLNQEATATEELLRTYGWKEEESLQAFLHRIKQRPCDPMNHSPEYLTSLLQDCENKLTQATDEIARLRDYIDHAQRTLNAALSASENAADETRER